MKKLIAVISLFLLTGCFGTANEMAAREGSVIFALPAPGIFQTAACLKLSDSFNLGAGSPADFSPVGTTITTTKQRIHAATRQIFNSLITESFKNVIRTAMALSVVFFGLGMMLGVVRLNVSEVITRFFKIAFILTLVSSWAMFSGFESEGGNGVGVVVFFETITESLIGIFTEVFLPASVMAKVGAVKAIPGVATGLSNAFGIIDRIVYSFFTLKFWRVFLALLFTGPQGVLYALFLLVVVVLYLLSIFRATYLYIISLIAKALLFSLAPVFLTFMLFGQTKSLFDNWLKQLVNFSLQPILIFAFVAFFSGLIFTTLSAGFGSNMWVCYTAIEKIPFWQTMLTLISPLFWPLFLGKVFPTLLGTASTACAGTGPLAPICWGIYILLINPITLRLLVTFLFYTLGLIMDNMGDTFRVVTNWWRFVIGTDTNPVGPPMGLSYVPIDFSIFAITFILSYLMWRMGDWAKDTASALSGGGMSMNASMRDFKPLADGAAGAVGTAARLGGTGIGIVGRAFKGRAPASSAKRSDLSADAPEVRGSTRSDLSPGGTPSPTSGGPGPGSGPGGSTTP